MQALANASMVCLAPAHSQHTATSPNQPPPHLLTPAPRRPRAWHTQSQHHHQQQHQHLHHLRPIQAAAPPSATTEDPLPEAEAFPEEEALPGADTQLWAPEGLPGPGAWAGMVSAWPPQPLDPGLYIVPTPIGNLADITLRALSTLKSVNLILAEDTRHSRKLLTHYGIRAELLSCHEHNERGRLPGIVQRLQQGEPVALISDAGTPGISDPGQQVIAAAIQAGVPVIPLPGACAFVPALVASGLDTSAFTFVGFLPPKQGARRTRLESLKLLPTTLTFYAPPHGLRAVLADMVAVLGPGRRVCVARELTKRHEELLRSDLAGALEAFTTREPRGEFCLVVEGAPAPVAGMAGWPAMGNNTGVVGGMVKGGAQGEGQQGEGSGREGRASLHDQGGEMGAIQVAGGAVLGDGTPLERAQVLIQALVSQGASRKDACMQAARQLGLKKKELYALSVGASGPPEAT